MNLFRWFRQRASGAQDECLDCHGVQANCSEFVEGTLNPSVSEQFRAHMGECADCNGFVATFRATVLTLRNLPRRTAPFSLRERISDALAHERHPGA